MPLFGKNYIDLADEALMQLVADGDQRAFNVLYDRYSSAMLNYFYRMLWKDREKAEDFMQDLFTKIIHKPHLYDPKRKFKTWLYSVANNMCKNEYRKQEVRKNTSSGLHENIAVSDGGHDPNRSMDTKMFNKQLQEELMKLDDKQRATFIMRYKQDMSIKEIAATFDCSEGTVKSRLFYTLKKLSDKLKIFDPKQKEYGYGS
jgi:RNA polymerase sigma-70 factor (ECF subfamily)